MFIYFKYRLKEVYLDIDPNMPFKIVLGELKEKYDWMNDINIKYLSFNGAEINLNLSCIQIGIPSDSKILIVE